MPLVGGIGRPMESPLKGKPGENVGQPGIRAGDIRVSQTSPQGEIGPFSVPNLNCYMYKCCADGITGSTSALPAIMAIRE